MAGEAYDARVGSLNRRFQFGASVRTAIVTTLFAVVTVTAFVLVLLNRASEKILTAVIPIAVAGLVAIYLAVFVFGGEPTVTVVFPTSFLYQADTKMPANLPHLLLWRRFSPMSFLPEQLYSQHPEYFADTADSDGSNIYHDLLQRAILDWMAQRYSGTWQVEVTQFELPSFRSQEAGPAAAVLEPSKTYSADEIGALMRGNKFAGVRSPMASRLSVPQDAELAIEPPHHENALGRVGRIFLKTKYCNILIQTQRSSRMTGIGQYGTLAGLTKEEDSKLVTAIYRVRVTIEYSKWRSGHPKKPLYDNWARGIAKGLQDQFDEQSIWTNAKADYLFQRQVEQLGPLRAHR
jgi:hypothetical protein